MPARRRPRASWASSSPVGTWSTGASAGRSFGSHVPSRGSTYRSVSTVITIAQKNVDTIAK